MFTWLLERNSFLLKLLRLDGRGDYILQDTCRGGIECLFPPLYRCKDCFTTELYCKHCTVEKHHEIPLHRIEYWNDGYFSHATLKFLGLRIQLSHACGECCYNPSPAFHDNFVVLDINGVHEVALDFCACQLAQSHAIQLLRTRWYPSTTTAPQSAATPRLLHHFHILSFESKASAFEYWQLLAHLTNNTGVSPTKDCYEALLRMIKQCWKFALFLAIDANFRLARKNVSFDVDPGLSRGWSYFVEDREFKSFLNDAGTLPQEKSTCASHSAVNLADTKNARGLAVTGVGTVDCTRHNLKRLCAIGDLQKGERYVNMDYLLFSTLQHTRDIIVLNISYNIACQWSKHIWKCMSSYPSAIHFDRTDKNVVFLVPKFHLPAHINACQIRFSYNLVKGVGRTDGEAPERGWANINPVATSTCEMGPGSRLLHRIKTAIPEYFNQMLSHERLNEVNAWKSLIERWEEDRSQPNPFEIMSKSMSQAAVRLSLSQKEASDLERGVNDSLHSDISPSILISSGMDYEDQQCHLRRDHRALSVHATDLQLAKFQERSNALQRKIAQWCTIQLLYFPSVAHLRSSDIESSIDSTQEEKPTDINLWLPSQISFSKYEWDLRRAQAFDALEDLRRHLRLRTHLYIKNVEINVSVAAERYHRAWNALSALAPSLARDAWTPELPNEFGESSGNHTLSWIWKVRGVATAGMEGEAVLSEALRVEWCRSRACANQWVEEVELLLEEMRCVSAFLAWHAAWWDEQAT
ncbi:hypothetical protein DFJ58DRAFT_717719 [Suillus subalutaceus]|uniref:uncharacterized protein n=1 Tax=Suillus subalutaceus TaxID=48586 RepID=UPI001B861BA7|nr:uncharacterized protein DFJ58DRAFT_717719 [Suillus subalutaceus]KAG1843773.1 hypothetical protein DFJ58DRAFT_717719 [Suillus subalutaceus]